MLSQNVEKILDLLFEENYDEVIEYFDSKLIVVPDRGDRVARHARISVTEVIL